MKAVATAWLTYQRAFPIQRALGIAAIVGVVLSLLDPLGRLAGMVLVCCFSLSVMMAAGWLLRMFSQSRVHRLLPHFRARMLTAIVLLTLSHTLLVVLLFAAPVAANPTISVPQLTTFVLGFVSLLLWTTLFAPWSIIVAALFLSAFVIPQGAELRDAAPMAGTILAALWLIFGVWYLRARGAVRPLATGPSRWLFGRWRLESLGRRFSDTSGSFSERQAIESCLNARYPARFGVDATAIITIIVVAAAVLLLLLPGAAQRSIALLAFFGLALSCELVAATSLIARGTRRLWLSSGKSRVELFTVAEHAAWRKAFVLMLPMLALTLVAGLALRVDADVLGAVTALLVSGSLLATYLGLAMARGWTFAAVAAFASLPASFAIAVAALFAEAPRTGLVVYVVAFQLGAAGTARVSAVFNWRSIDWLTFRLPHRPLSAARHGG